MKIVFMGTPEFAVVSLKKLVDQDQHDICSVVTAPDRPKGRGQKILPSPVKKFALENGIEVLQPGNFKDPDFINKLQFYNADVFVVVAFKILPREIFTIPPAGTVNIHASLLPKYRGAAPINWAIINGEAETGVTTMLINEKVDTGNILLQRKIPIPEDMTAGELHDQLAEIGATLLIETLEQIHVKSFKLISQNDALATKAPKIHKEICRINFSKPASEVYNLIRGLSPFPAAFTYHNDKLIKIYRCKVSDDRSTFLNPGTIESVGKDFIRIKCGEGSIDVTEVRLEGKKRVPIKDFLNGYKIIQGDSFK